MYTVWLQVFQVPIFEKGTLKPLKSVSAYQCSCLSKRRAPENKYALKIQRDQIGRIFAQSVIVSFWQGLML
jgi:hypothetical protein